MISDFLFTSGHVTIDGVDLRNLDPTLLRKKIGFVTQEPTLFSATIRENILFGFDRPEDVSEERLHDAGKLANCHGALGAFRVFSLPLSHQRARIAL